MSDLDVDFGQLELTVPASSSLLAPQSRPWKQAHRDWQTGLRPYELTTLLPVDSPSLAGTLVSVVKCTC